MLWARKSDLSPRERARIAKVDSATALRARAMRTKRVVIQKIQGEWWAYAPNGLGVSEKTREEAMRALQKFWPRSRGARLGSTPLPHGPFHRTRAFCGEQQWLHRHCGPPGSDCRAQAFDRALAARCGWATKGVGGRRQP